MKACFTLAQASPPHIRKQGAGRIIGHGSEALDAGLRCYIVSKAAVTGFIQTAAIEYATDNITVNVVELRYIDTPGPSS